MTAPLRRFNPLAPFLRLPDGPVTPEQTQANIRNLVLEVALFGVVWGAVINYLQVYVARLGGSALMVGAVTYGPAMVNILWQLPAAQLMARLGHRMRWVITGGFLFRLGFGVVAIVPWLVDKGRVEITVAVLTLQAFAQVISNTSFLAMLTDAVPAGRMTQVVGWRMAGFGLANSAATFAAGMVLPLLAAPLNFQLVFLIAFGAGMVSWGYVIRLRVPDRPHSFVVGKSILRDVPRLWRYPGFARFALSVGVLQLALGMIAPLAPLYWVRSIGATDAQISLVVTTFAGAMVIGSLLMRRVVLYIGKAYTLALGVLGYALYPLLTSLSPTITGIIPWAALGGFFNACITVTLVDNLLTVTPDEDRTAYIAVYNIVVYLALFLGPLLAGVITDAASPALGLRLAAGVAVLGAVMLGLRQARLREA